tara:strand:+ start:186 stop:494 length:309 start_codon:yes stop_codon:yes gene_type:complete
LISIVLNLGIEKITLSLPNLSDQKIAGPSELNLIKNIRNKKIGDTQIKIIRANDLSIDLDIFRPFLIFVYATKDKYYASTFKKGSLKVNQGLIKRTELFISN